MVDGPVEDLRTGKPGRFETLDIRVEGVPVHVYGEGRRAALVRLATERGGPICEGTRMRVSLRAGKVLKFEIREGPTSGARGASQEKVTSCAVDSCRRAILHPNSAGG